MIRLAPLIRIAYIEVVLFHEDSMRLCIFLGLSLLLVISALLPSLSRATTGTGGGDAIEPLTGNAMSDQQGDQFTQFLQRVYSLPEGERQAAADSFLQAAGTMPFIVADSVVYYLYRGGATTVAVAGDANGWDPSPHPLNRVSGTNLWFLRQNYESDARLDYKFVLNNSSWILDPRNPLLCYGGYGPNSELRMPAYLPAAECTTDTSVSGGIIDKGTFVSTILANSRSLRVYLPAGYDPQREEGYPMVLFHDGLEFLTLGDVKTVLDNLIGWKRIEPMIGVFVPPVSSTQRIEEYSGATAVNFERFIIEELVPHIDSTYNTAREPARRGMMGPSLAALISAQICFHHPEVFGLCGLYSPAMWPNDRVVLRQLLATARPFQKCYIDAGSYEPSLIGDAQALFAHLLDGGVETRYRLWHEGHSWGSWRAHVDEALEFFFPLSTGIKRFGAAEPRKLQLHPAYPNPFNAEVTLEFSLPRPERVSLAIYNIRGEMVEQWAQQDLQAGRYRQRWTAAGRPSGLYVYRLRAGADVRTGRVLLLR